MKLLCIVVLTLILYISGILLFTKGFLLKRITVTLNSTCVPPVSDDRPLVDSSCWVKPYFRKSVFIIIDALRFDFVTYDQTSQPPVPYYRNKLTCMFETARDSPNNARLYRFIADPPTTTLQRLKGLTTGSLPTFVDAGTNFASTEICEDNIIDQFVSRGSNITFMGDDTWQVIMLITTHI
jgi:GPI ethanolamine phosphate transferase 3 subunit O